MRSARDLARAALFRVRYPLEEHPPFAVQLQRLDVGVERIDEAVGLSGVSRSLISQPLDHLVSFPALQITRPLSVAERRT
jgi:hypothetical protein